MVTKLKANLSHLLPGDLHLTESQQYQWNSGKFLWPSIVHSLKTVKKMKVSLLQKLSTKLHHSSKLAYSLAKALNPVNQKTSVVVRGALLLPCSAALSTGGNVNHSTINRRTCDFDVIVLRLQRCFFRGFQFETSFIMTDNLPGNFFRPSGTFFKIIYSCLMHFYSGMGDNIRASGVFYNFWQTIIVFFSFRASLQGRSPPTYITTMLMCAIT